MERKIQWQGEDFGELSRAAPDPIFPRETAAKPRQMIA